MNEANSSWRRVSISAVAWLVAQLCLHPYPGLARETDNFHLPLDKELADIGGFLEAVHTFALEETVRELNYQIERALAFKNPTNRAAQLDRLHDSSTMAEAYVKKFGHFMLDDAGLEKSLQGEWGRSTYPDQMASHSDIRMNYAGHALLDPRKLGMLSQSHTVKACGIYFGTDKIVHFHQLGASYYLMYQSLLRRGFGKQEALRIVIQEHTNGGMTESGWLGTLLTGIYSNADLAANYAGFKFYLNLTDEVVLKGRPRAPLVIRTGVFWRLNHHVRSRSGWFCTYLSDHWNEALNPNLYKPQMRSGIQQVLISRAEKIVQFYTQKDGRPKYPSYFDHLAHELSTYFGESYGHSGQFDQLLTIGNTCIRALSENNPGPDN